MALSLDTRKEINSTGIVKVDSNLLAGKYRFTLTVINSAGQKSKVAQISVTVAPRITGPVRDPIFPTRPGPVFEPRIRPPRREL